MYGWLILIFLMLILIWLVRARPFLWRSIRMAYHSGRLGPAIDEMEQFSNKKISASNPVPWQHHPYYNQFTLSSDHRSKQQRLRTTSFIVIHKEQILFEEYWEPFTAATPTNSFSVAKSIVNVLIGMLEKEGSLRLSDPVARFLPSFDDDIKRTITVQHLLSMSSGLSWSESEGSIFSDNAEAYYGTDTEAIIHRLRAKRPPGQVFRYASGNTQILALLIREITGKSVADLAAERLWPVIEAEHDAYWNLDRPGGLEKAFCCYYAVPRDFARIGQLFLNQGRWGAEQLVNPDFIQTSLTPVPLHDIWINKTNVHYGLHWWVVNHQGHDYFYARGIRGQYVICSRDLSLVIVRMGHKRNPVSRIDGHSPDLFDHINAGLEIFRSIPQ